MSGPGVARTAGLAAGPVAAWEAGDEAPVVVGASCRARLVAAWVPDAGAAVWS